MQKYPNDYQPYLAEPIQQYCSTRIEPSVVEIEEVGLSALLAVLVQPAGIATEVHYLDRSDGDLRQRLGYHRLQGNSWSCPS